MNTKKLIVIAVLVLGAVGAWLFIGSGSSQNDDGAKMPKHPPVDTVLDYYNDWLDARQATDTDPYAAGLSESPELTSDVQTYLRASQSEMSKLDPVLCQTSVPEKIGTKEVYIKEGEAKILVLARGADKMPGQATVTLIPQEGEWVISNIVCSYGETAPEQGEYSFEREGQLLKSVPAPYDSNFWHLVYEDQGLNGLVAQLSFDDTSMCIGSDGAEAVCNPDAFQQTAKAFVQGDVSEDGIAVKRLELR